MTTTAAATFTFACPLPPPEIHHQLGHREFGKAVVCPACFVPPTPQERSPSLPWQWEDDYALTLLDTGSPAREAMEAWLVTREPALLVLCGSPGSGKTHASIGAGMQLSREGLCVYFTTVITFLARLRASFDAEGQSFERTLAPATGADALILDDLGREKETDWVRERLFALVDERYSARRLTIVTSNKLPNEAPEDDPLWSRLLGNRGSLVAITSGPDRRHA